ncbi:SCO1664 family protein [Streptomyces sp. ST2-7A]|uniref:SCO1664 family protein n=1 Tax=Streptomyces sp. ST2-7A TaxID=2907214 RepID=UPI001F239515|nr:SCO1664 family protein [Streptomyces sp. ST2-7A]MCE7083261.1 SCO1664 family protein [Streptomyces sp. ST2-7A]
MSAPERIPTGAVSPVGAAVEPALERVLERGELTPRGRLTGASNAVLFGSVELDGRALPCVWKPVAGERPLWDFPDGTLAAREVAAREVCRAMGWELIPPTVLREGPGGPGMCQLWIGPPPDGEDPDVEAFAGEDPEGFDVPGPGDPGIGDPDTGEPDTDDPAGEEPVPLLALIDAEEPGPGWRAVGRAEVGPGRTALLVHADDGRLRRLAVLDAVINNGDRKGGHLLPRPDGRLYAIDHGVTFHTEDRLRTLLWGWAGEPLPPAALTALRALEAALEPGTALATRMAELLTAAEIEALRDRAGALLASGRHPAPGGEWPPIPWPPI